MSLSAFPLRAVGRFRPSIRVQVGWLLLAGACVVGATPPVIPASVTQAVRQRVDFGYSAGIAVGLIHRDGRAFHGYGRRDRDRPGAPDEHTLFEIGSVTKVLTSLLLAEAVHRGELDGNDTVASLLPDRILPRGRDREMTLLQLATHRSGLPVNPDNLCVEDVTRPFECYTEERWRDFLERHVPPREPGSAWEYSNTGFGLLGYALAARAGVSYEALLRERVLGPLGMTSTIIDPDDDQAERLAKGHSSVLKRPPFRLPVLEGAGALRSTVSDLLTFLSFQLGLEDTPLRPAMRDIETFRTATTYPGMGMGMGWFLWDLPGGRVLQHGGETPGFTAFVGCHPARGIGAVVLSNSRVNAYTAVTDIGLRLLDSSYPLTPIRRPADVPQETLASYMGVYQGPGGDSFEIGRVLNRLVGYHVRSDFEFVLVPESARRLLVLEIEVGPNVAAQFQVAANGRVTGMDWTQGGQTASYTRTGDPARLTLSPSGHEIGIGIVGGGDVPYEIQASSDQTRWEKIGSVTANSEPLHEVIRRAEPRFYRAVRRRNAGLEFGHFQVPEPLRGERR
ncbi:MAG: beta-lactamase family protein [Verrucomicrobiae bacterium]|nr:beta-lactamase family protein [Verrucomicrobiae bacterium]